MVRQKLGEWQARYTSMIINACINGIARRSYAVSCSAVAIPGASQTYHTTLSQLPKGAEYTLRGVCHADSVIDMATAWKVFILSKHGDEDSELVAHVVQLMVQLTTRVGPKFHGPPELVCRKVVQAQRNICSFTSLFVFACLAGLSGSEELQHLRHLQDQS